MKNQIKAVQEINVDDGFSSDSDNVLEQQAELHHPTTSTKQQQQQQGRWKLPSPQKIRQQPYSLKPDIQTGWTSRLQKPKPVPIIHQNPFLDPLILKVMKEGSRNKIRLVYLGPRYPSTYEAWYGRMFPNPYSHIERPSKMKITNRQYAGSKEDTQTCLIFDAEMQSGNLDAAIRIGEKEYELFLRVDSNTKGHIQWFNFKVKNMMKGQKYTFHICNFQKHSSLYHRGAKPYLFSQAKNQTENVGWEQKGFAIKYEKKVPKTAKILNFQTIQTMYRLTFQYQSEYNNDVVQMAYCVPYTYTNLNQFLQRLIQNQKRNYLRMIKLCTSLGGLDVPLLIIDEKEQIKKKCVIISGRAHPGQSNGSFMMEGFIKFLCSSSFIAKNLRKQITFKIVPMLNPDGVAIGNYRTGLSGKDFNREFRLPDQKIFPQVYNIKKLISDTKDEYKDNFLMFLDFHGHSVKKNVFMYGPQFSITNKNYYDCRVFPKILSDCTNMFRYHSCMFKISDFKISTARAVVLRKLNIPFSYTIQASNGSYYDHDELKDVSFNEEKWILMGEKIVQSMNEYVKIFNESESQKKKRINNRERKVRKVNIPQVTNTKKFSQHSKKTKKTIANEYELDSKSLDDETKLQRTYLQIQNLEEIKEKENEDNSENELSEGSSDQEDETNDLDEEKLKVLYKLIKKKTTGETYSQKDINKFLNESQPGKEYLTLIKKNKKQIQNINNKTQLQYFTDRKHGSASSRIHAKRSSFFEKKKTQEINELKLKLNGTKKVSFGSSFMESQRQKHPATERARSNTFYPQFCSYQESFRLKKQTHPYQGLNINKKMRGERSTDLQKEQKYSLQGRKRKKKFQNRQTFLKYD